MRDSWSADFLRVDGASESGRAALPGVCRWFHWGGWWKWRGPDPSWAEGGDLVSCSWRKESQGIRTVHSSFKVTGKEKWQMHQKIIIHFISYHLSGKPLSESTDYNFKCRYPQTWQTQIGPWLWFPRLHCLFLVLGSTPSPSTVHLWVTIPCNQHFWCNPL